MGANLKIYSIFTVYVLYCYNIYHMRITCIYINIYKFVYVYKHTHIYIYKKRKETLAQVFFCEF